jgi:3-deoxy-D-manno-octulosonic-acid transferase
MLKVYRIIIHFFYPIIILITYFRKFVGKEDKKKFIEKIYPTNIVFKDKGLVWFHAASIGELKSIIPIINFLIKIKKKKVLLTTITYSSGKLVEKKFKNNKFIFHRYMPFDLPFLINKFLDSFQPKSAIFVDSEIWPNFIYEIKSRQMKLILLNARITKKTFDKWKILNKFATSIFSKFDLCLCSNKNSLNFLKKLNAKKVKMIGNLKFITTEKNVEKLKDSTLKKLRKYKVWCAASTHKGEELFCLNAHKIIKHKYSNVLTIIIPRHIERVNEIVLLCKDLKLRSKVINLESDIDLRSEVIIINSFGILNKYFNYCNSVFMGKSVLKNKIKVGGQNPLEAVRSGCKVYHGPYVYNFQEIYNFLNQKRISYKIQSSKLLANKIISDFSKKTHHNKAINVINKHGQLIYNKTIKELKNFI